MIQALGQLFVAVSSIINLDQITASQLQSSEKHLLKTNPTSGNEEQSCMAYDKDILDKINRLGYSWSQNTIIISNNVRHHSVFCDQ